MFVLIQDQSGVLVEGVLLAAGAGEIRVAARHARDTITLRLENGNWLFDDGTATEVVALIAGEGDAALCSELFPLAQTAGSRMRLA